MWEKEEWLSAENNNPVSLTSTSLSISNPLSGKHRPINKGKDAHLLVHLTKKSLKSNTTKKLKQCKAANIFSSAFSVLSSHTTSCFLSHTVLRFFCTIFAVTCFSPAANQITWIITSQRAVCVYVCVCVCVCETCCWYSLVWWLLDVASRATCRG